MRVSGSILPIESDIGSVPVDTPRQRYLELTTGTLPTQATAE